MTTTRKTPQEIQDRFFSKVQKTETCWLWMAAKSNGYGLFSVERKMWKAHRWIYEMKHGPITKGFCLDHLCRVRNCVNPFHLEKVTAKENTLRGETVTACNSKRTHCVHGHEFNKENTKYRIRKGGGRICLVCKRMANTEHKRQKRRSLKTG